MCIPTKRAGYQKKLGSGQGNTALGIGAAKSRKASIATKGSCRKETQERLIDKTKLTFCTLLQSC
jgi:hypothetical protein